MIANDLKTKDIPWLILGNKSDLATDPEAIVSFKETINPLVAGLAVMNVSIDICSAFTG